MKLNDTKKFNTQHLNTHWPVKYTHSQKNRPEHGHFHESSRDFTFCLFPLSIKYWHPHLWFDCSVCKEQGPDRCRVLTFSNYRETSEERHSAEILPPSWWRELTCSSRLAPPPWCIRGYYLLINAWWCNYSCALYKLQNLHLYTKWIIYIFVHKSLQKRFGTHDDTKSHRSLSLSATHTSQPERATSQQRWTKSGEIKVEPFQFLNERWKTRDRKL